MLRTQKKVSFLLQGPKWHHAFYPQNQMCVMNQIPNDFGMFGIVWVYILDYLETILGNYVGATWQFEKIPYII
jgi:hypothetical protein